ncbi:hypothetical protein JTB14_006019 [Gonioctena quinquepunctata]|nr:hypothetical protein JTB14_006019 [Gonioctena quinquepunctata]
MKLDENTPAQHVANKELRLKKYHQLLHGQVFRLKNKEGHLSEYEDLLNGYEEFGGKSKHSHMKKLAENAGNIIFPQENFADSSYNDMENSNRAIEEISAEQTIGNQLVEFDDSSCLMARLTRGLTRETVEMILIT